MKRKYLLIAAILAVAMMAMCACGGGGTFSIDCSDAKAAHVEANKAATNEWVVTGSLETEEGETVTMSANLEKGEIKIELFGTAEEQSMEELPENPEGEPAMVFMASGTDSMSGTLPAGSYMIKATVTEKATGSVDITASAAGN